MSLIYEIALEIEHESLEGIVKRDALSGNGSEPLCLPEVLKQYISRCAFLRQRQVVQNPPRRFSILFGVVHVQAAAIVLKLVTGRLAEQSLVENEVEVISRKRRLFLFPITVELSSAFAGKRGSVNRAGQGCAG